MDLADLRLRQVPPLGELDPPLPVGGHEHLLGMVGRRLRQVDQVERYRVLEDLGVQDEAHSGAGFRDPHDAVERLRPGQHEVAHEAAPGKNGLHLVRTAVQLVRQRLAPADDEEDVRETPLCRLPRRLARRLGQAVGARVDADDEPARVVAGEPVGVPAVARPEVDDEAFGLRQRVNLRGVLPDDDEHRDTVALSRMRITGHGRGHPAIRASHHKTLELSRDTEITERATCIVAVGVDLDEAALAGHGGAARLTLTAGGLTETVNGRLNPAFRPGDPLVVRLSGAAARNALLIGADRSASDLERDLVAALAAGSDVEISVEVPEPTRPLFADGGTDPEDVAAALDAGIDVLPAPGQSALDAAHAVSGLARADAEVSLTADGAAALAWVERAGAGVVGVDVGTPREHWIHVRPGLTPSREGIARRPAIAVAVGRPRGLDAAHRALARELLVGGASTREVVARLQEETGLPRKLLYDAVLAVRDSP